MFDKGNTSRISEQRNCVCWYRAKMKRSNHAGLPSVLEVDHNVCVVLLRDTKNEPWVGGEMLGVMRVTPSNGHDVGCP